MHPGHLDSEVSTVDVVSINNVVVEVIRVDPVHNRSLDSQFKDGRRRMDDGSDGVSNHINNVFFLGVRGTVGAVENRDVPSTSTEVATIGIKLAARKISIVVFRGQVERKAVRIVAEIDEVKVVIGFRGAGSRILSSTIIGSDKVAGTVVEAVVARASASKRAIIEEDVVGGVT